MPTRRPSRAALAALLLVLCAGLTLTMAASADAKKKKKSGKTPVFRQSVSPNVAIPDAPASGPSTPATSTINVGKKFKGKVIADLNVTEFQTTGSAGTAAGDLRVRLIGPTGRSLVLLGTPVEGTSIGPLTWDDDVFTEMCYTNPPCQWAPQTLDPPFAGTANLLFNGAAGQGPLAAYNGQPMQGTWTLSVWDESAGLTSVLNGWGLEITAKKPVAA